MRLADVIHLRAPCAGCSSELCFPLESTQRLSHLAHQVLQGLPLGHGFACIQPVFERFVLPLGAPDPFAPPCILQRIFPATAGDRHGFPDLVLAPHRGLCFIAAVWRG